MATPLEELASLLGSIKATSTGKVEYNNNSESMRAVMLKILDLFTDQSIVVVDSIAAMEALQQPQPPLAYTKGSGLFAFYDTSPTGMEVYPASGGGFWAKVFDYSNVKLSDLADVSTATPANNNVLYFDSSTGKWTPITALNLIARGGWPTTLSGYGITGDKILTKAVSLLRFTNDTDVTFKAGAANSIVMTARAIPNLTIGSNSVLITGQASLIAGDPSAEMQNCVIIGDVGNALGSPLTNRVVIGTNGKGFFFVAQDEQISIGPSGATANIVINGHQNVNGNLVVAANYTGVNGTFSGTLAVAGASSLHNTTVTGTHDVSGNATVGGTLITTGLSALNGGLTSKGNVSLQKTDATPVLTINGATGATTIAATTGITGSLTLSGPGLTVSSTTVFSHPTNIFSALPVYADNTAAASLATGTLYRTSVGQVMIKY